MSKSTEFTVTDLSALEILDSRGNPTLRVNVVLGSGVTGRAGVPSGASTGSREAVELRDGDPARYGGKGVTAAVGNVNGELRDLLRARSWGSLAEVDQAMIDADGTHNRHAWGPTRSWGSRWRWLVR
jgi:enolase